MAFQYCSTFEKHFHHLRGTTGGFPVLFVSVFCYESQWSESGCAVEGLALFLSDESLVGKAGGRFA